jgi:hypothetical protein
LLKKEISLINLTADTAYKTPFRLQFHASGFNVAHMQQKEKDTGHFRLIMTALRGGKTSEIAFTNGQTETWLSPPSGTYKMKLELVSNEFPDKVLGTSEVISMHVRDSLQ